MTITSVRTADVASGESLWSPFCPFAPSMSDADVAAGVCKGKSLSKVGYAGGSSSGVEIGGCRLLWHRSVERRMAARTILWINMILTFPLVSSHDNAGKNGSSPWIRT